MKKQPKLPKDLGIKIGTKLEVMWTNVKNNLEAEIKTLENQLIVNKIFLKSAKIKIAFEQKSRKV